MTETVKAEASELKFDFYTLLKNTEIIVPSDEPSTDTPGFSAAMKTSSYLLQAGSFKIASDAEALRVKLLLLNLSASCRNRRHWQR